MTAFRPRGAIERRRQFVKSVSDAAVAVTSTQGEVLLQGLGETSIDINFATMFSERPIMAFGSALDEASPPVIGSLPSARVAVLKWQVVGRVDGAFDGYYTGCTLGIVTVGSDTTQLLWVHWTATAPALTNPTTSGTGTTSGVI